MRWHAALLGLFVGTATASCAFLLDFEELQTEKGAATGGSGGTGGTDSGDAEASIPIAEAAQKFAEAICARFEECMPGASPLVYGDVPCVEYTARRIGDGILAGLDQLPKDTAEYHPELAPACVTALRALGADSSQCPKALDWPVECEKTVQGKVLEGKGCVHPAQCAPDLYCNLATACPGTCTKEVGKDVPCLEGMCQEGLRCEEFKAQKASFCKAPIATPGAPCGGDSLPRCAIGMLCVGAIYDADAGTDAGPAAGKCKSAGSVFGFGLGAKCSWASGDLCQPGLHCRFTDGVGNGTCADPLQKDDPCGLAIPDMCPAGQYCKPDLYEPPKISLSGSCTNLPGVDEACAFDATFNEDCKADTRCVAGTCKALIAISTKVPCKDNEVCYSGLCNSVCVPPIFCGQ